MLDLMPRTLRDATVMHDGTLTLIFAEGQTLTLPPELGSPYESWYAAGADSAGAYWEVICESGAPPDVFVVADGVDLDLPPNT
jgi:hypothetical protein